MKDKIYGKVPVYFLNFFKKESASGLILLSFAVLAMIIANSSYADTYFGFLDTYITIGYGQFSLSMSVLHWINDGLMTLFFLMVGMEIKREIAFGELKSRSKMILPVSAAIGGLVIPAIIYLIFNANEPTSAGWGVPMATDIAFALGILSFVGKKAPKGIVVFLTALAVVDDLGAILVIAIFYTSQIYWVALVIGLVILIALALANRFKVKAISIYIIGGILLWFFVLKSGIHPTFAGVLLGLVLPIGKNETEYQTSISHRFETKLLTWSSFVIMPIFAFANSGITIDFPNLSTLLLEPVSLGIVLGLVIGKQLGIFGVSFLLVKSKIATLPDQVSLKYVYGASVLGGIGFTMSLFIASLSFLDATVLSTAKMSIMIASLLSGILGAIVFKLIELSEDFQTQILQEKA
ncbi:MAG: Na+/H+ antiporter NhaA [Acetobacterium woodii]|nr:Na+/H+ antiporter NhaA [Acetobacterium woodii]